MKYITTLICVLLLASCSSSAPTPEETKYYLLNSPLLNKSAIKPKATTALATKQPVILIVNVAEYLQQPFLAMQVDAHTLHYAQSHLWAEPLKKELSIALAHELNQLSNTKTFKVIQSNPLKKPDAKLRINVEHFHASNTGNVILTGNFYWIAPKEETKEKSLSESKYSEKHTFYLETPLQDDGFSHAVAKMRTLVEQLAREINQQ